MVVGMELERGLVGVAVERVALILNETAGVGYGGAVARRLRATLVDAFGKDAARVEVVRDHSAGGGSPPGFWPGRAVRRSWSREVAAVPCEP